MVGKISHFATRLLIFTLLASFLFVGGCANTREGPSHETMGEANDVLFAYVGANLKEPFTELAENYTEQTGIKVEITFNNAGALLNQFEAARKGDIYVPGGMFFANKAQEKGFVDKMLGPIAYHTPVIVVPKDNPANITSIYDLADPGVDLLVPDLEATAIGKTVNKVFDNSEKADEIKENIIATLESPPKVMAAIKMGQGNAGVVEYSNTLKDRDSVIIIEIDPKVNEIDEIPIILLNSSTNKGQALDFLNYVGEKGSQAFEKYGFKVPK